MMELFVLFPCYTISLYFLLGSRSKIAVLLRVGPAQLWRQRNSDRHVYAMYFQISFHMYTSVYIAQTKCSIRIYLFIIGVTSSKPSQDLIVLDDVHTYNKKNQPLPQRNYNLLV